MDGLSATVPDPAKRVPASLHSILPKCNDAQRQTARENPAISAIPWEFPHPSSRLSKLWMLALVVSAMGMDLTEASSTISSSDRFAYAANAGWIDFRTDADSGVRVDETFLSGYAYAANFGWIHLGDGSPENGHSYSNNSSTDYGVNLAVDGKLSGYAYSASIGWITFEQQWGQPVMNYSTGRFSGHAYAANAGWIALDTPSSDLAAASIAAPTDSDGDGISDAWERLQFGNLTSAHSATDADRDGATDLGEYLAGTEPDDSDSRLRIVSNSFDTANRTAFLTFTTAPNRLYLIQQGNDLQESWTDSGLGLIAPDPGAKTSRTFVHPVARKLFLRVQAHKPLNP